MEDSKWPASVGEVGHCAMRGSCGRKGWFGASLPCPYSGPPVELENKAEKSLLLSTCGPDYAEGPVCCTGDQVETLRANFDQVEGIISSCPACRNNFRSFFCSFTCSPNQGTFTNITSTQTTSSGQTAVKSLDFFTGNEFTDGFFDSCKDVKMGAANEFAMTFIGGGAKNSSAFLKFLGDEKDLGSPFQINFPDSTPDGFEAYDPPSRGCSDLDLQSRCTCTDCSAICPALPYVPPPGSESVCHVGAISCFSFTLTIVYGLAVIAFLFGYMLRLTLQKRQEKGYERVALGVDTASDNPLSPRSHTRSLIGASSLARYIDGEESLGEHSGDSRRLGRGASLLDPMETTLQPRQYRLNTILRRFFYRVGLLCACHPWLTLAVVFTATGALNSGWKYFTIETDPVRLWVAPNSESKLQKEFFDQSFGPFFRTEQIFVTSATSFAETDPTSPHILKWENIRWFMEVEASIRSLRSSPNGYTLSDVCFKPNGPEGPCVVQSLRGWFGDDWETYEDTWKERIRKCTSSAVDCRPDYGLPLTPEYILGGVPKDGKDWFDAQAMVSTFVVSDSLDPLVREKAMEWERTLRLYLEALSSTVGEEVGLQIYFSTGVSLEEELNKSTNTDVKTIVLSYLLMFFYVALTLGNGTASPKERGLVDSLWYWCVNLRGLFKARFGPPSSNIVDADATWLPHIPRALFVNSKFALGLFGIGLVILSVSTSVAFFSIVGVKSTLIIAEVIPFLVLAVGVDNVFILVHELNRQNAAHGPNPLNLVADFPSGALPVNGQLDQPRPQDESGDVISVAGSPLPVEERVARALAKMGPSILLSSVTETVAFALGALVPMPAVRNFALYAAGSVLLNAVLQVTVFVSALTIDLHRTEASRVDCFPCVRMPPRIALQENPVVPQSAGKLAAFMRWYYAPFLLRPFVKGVVLLSFAGIFVGSIISMQHIERGLDQRLALPRDSYLVPYFDALDAYFEVGPPVYFVATGVDAVNRPGQRALCGKFTTCEDYSVANILEIERNRSESSFISQPAAIWIDDFFAWLNPSGDNCCRVRKADPSLFCRPRDSPRLCQPCLTEWNITMEGLPEGADFMKYLDQWLISPANEECTSGGQAAYSSALSLNSTDVRASHFRTSHSPLKTQADFINAFDAAHRIANEMTEKTGVTIFPYSIFYVFFDQYAHIIGITQEVLGLGLASVLVVTALLLGSWRTGSIVTGVVSLTVIAVMGIMSLWGISLNAISLVNLVISLGIAVEFCAHIARAFMGAGTGLPVEHLSAQKERDERMGIALVDVGPSVLSGITFTKLIGVSVLAFTRTRLLEVYYFRMWLTLIISGALHGLVLLPVVLSLAGGPGYALEDSDEEWMTSAIRRHDREYTPFLADDDSVASY